MQALGPGWKRCLLLPYLVLLPVGFAKPGRSPGLLVSSYLTVSPLPPCMAETTQGGGLFSVALSLPFRAVGVTHHRNPVESGLSSKAKTRSVPQEYDPRPRRPSFLPRCLFLAKLYPKTQETAVLAQNFFQATKRILKPNWVRHPIHSRHPGLAGMEKNELSGD